MKQPRQVLIVLAVFVGALAVWVFWPCVHNDLLTWDDNVYMGYGARCQSLSPSSIWWAFTSPKAIYAYYHPLTTLSHALDFRLWGPAAAGNHATSVLLHGVNAALVVLAVWLFTGYSFALSTAERMAIAATVGTVFAIHPLQVQAVAWLSERKTVLSAMFSLGSLCAYFRLVAEPTTTGRRRKWAALLTVLFAAALLAKPMAVALPVVMLVLDVYPMRRLQALGWWPLVREKLWLFALSIAVALATTLVAFQVQATYTFEDQHLGQRLLLAARGIIFYPWKLIWPAWLSPYYPQEGYIRLWHSEFLGCALGVVAVTGVAVWLRKQLPGLLTAWLSYLVLILPMAGLVQGGHEAAGDRHMYLAMLPLLVLLAAGGIWLWRQMTKGLARPAIVGLMICYCLFLGQRTRGDIAMWRSDETLWRAVGRFFPDTFAANNNLAAALVRQGQIKEAIPYAREAVRRNPSNEVARTVQGLIDMHSGRYADARAQFRVAVELKPSLAAAHFDLACAEACLNQLDAALRSLEAALKLDPGFVRLMEHDNDLANLRNHPDYAPRLRALSEAYRDR